MSRRVTIRGGLKKAARGLLDEAFSQITGVRKKKKKKRVVKTYYMGKEHGMLIDGKYHRYKKKK